MNHIEFAALESAQLGLSKWDAWIKHARQLVGHDLDGDQAVDGYSLDGAHDAFERGETVHEYIGRLPPQVEQTALCAD